MNQKTIFFSVGDPSGDQNTATTVANLKKKYPQITCKGLGGPAMERAGFESLFEFSRFNKMGYREVLKDIFFFIKAKKEFVQLLKDEQPSLLVCVDSSGFNTPLMKAADALNIPVLWYIAPMIWAWKKKKHGPRLAKYASHIATLLPFEPDHWREFTPHVSYVGNPLLENGAYEKLSKRKALSQKEKITIALVPGSREMEITKMLPVMVESAKIVKEAHPQVTFLVSKTEYQPDHLYTIAEQANITFFEGNLEELYRASDIAIITSGTAVLQAGLSTIPHLLLYKASPITIFIAKKLIPHLKNVGLPSIMSNKEVAKEFIQEEMQPHLIAKEVEKLIHDDTYYNQRVDELSEVREKFGDKKPSDELLKLIEKLSAAEK